MKNRVLFLVVMLSAVVFLSACEEGKPLNLAETEQKTEDADISTERYSSNDKLFQHDSLQVQYQGGTYHVDSWKLYDNMAEANIPISNLSDYGMMLNEAGNDFKFMLVTISRTSTADSEGEFPKKSNVYIFPGHIEKFGRCLFTGNKARHGRPRLYGTWIRTSVFGYWRDWSK